MTTIFSMYTGLEGGEWGLGTGDYMHTTILILIKAFKKIDLSMSEVTQTNYPYSQHYWENRITNQFISFLN